MGRVVVMNHVTLDGVMQGPGRPDEDTRDGFTSGGWAVAASDGAMAARMGERMGGDRAFLFGRRTYEDLLASWNARGRPVQGRAERGSQVRRLGQPGDAARLAELDAAARRRPRRRGGPQAELGHRTS